MPVIKFGADQDNNIGENTHTEQSSELFKKKIFTGGENPDLFYSFILRYPNLIPDFYHTHNLPTANLGLTIALAAAHPIATILFTLSVLSIAAIGWAYETQEAEEKAKLDKIKAQLDETAIRQIQGVSTNSNTNRESRWSCYNPQTEEKLSSENKTQIDRALFPPGKNIPPPLRLPTEEWNNRLKHFAAKPQFARFKNAEIETNDAGGIQLKFKPHFSLLNTADAAWEMISTGSFIYWLSFIMVGTYMGALGLTLSGFALPALIGLYYAGLKSWHWYQHRKDDAKATLEDHACANALILECIANKRAPEKLRSNTYEENMRIFGAFFISAFQRYLITQYMLWYTGDFLLLTLGIAASPVAANAIGIGIFVLSIAVGAWAAYQKYQQINSAKAQEPQSQSAEEAVGPAAVEEKKEDPKDIAALEALENLIKARDAELAGIEGFLAQTIRFYGECHKHQAYLFLQYFMSAAFVARVFTLTITSAYIPTAFHITAAIATLSCPATMGIIAVSGVAYGAFRLYIDHLEKNAKKAQADAQPIQEKIKENCLKLHTLNDKIKESQAKWITRYGMFSHSSEAHAAPLLVTPKGSESRSWFSCLPSLSFSAK